MPLLTTLNLLQFLKLDLLLDRDRLNSGECISWKIVIQGNFISRTLSSYSIAIQRLREGVSPCLLWDLDFYEPENREKLLLLLKQYRDNNR